MRGWHPIMLNALTRQPGRPGQRRIVAEAEQPGMSLTEVTRRRRAYPS
jgi:hypothetical protein